MKRKKILMIFIMIFLIVVPFLVLIIKQSGFLHTTYCNPKTYEMLIELFIFFVVGFVGLRWRNPIFLGLELLIFAYFHQMLLAIIVAGVYIFLTAFLGKVLGKETNIFGGMFWGINFFIILYSILSFFNFADFKKIILIDFVLLLLSCIVVIFFYKKEVISFWTNAKKCQLTYQDYFKLEIIMCFLMLVIGRANISLDYDSVWYGLRGAYVINPGGSIFENVGLTGIVYTYSKGFEIFFLPLSFPNSYSFFYAGNICLLCLIFFVSYRIGRIFGMNHSKALWFPTLLSAIPAIMNMACTAKSDIITLLLQLIIVYDILLQFKYKKIKIFDIISKIIMTFVMKPSSLIFGFIIIVVYFSVILIFRKHFRLYRKFHITSFLSIIMNILVLILVWGRTYIITGLPEKTLLEKSFLFLGFEYRYPYSYSKLAAIGEVTFQKMIDNLSRIGEFLFAPQSESMNHVIIAWGTTLFTFCLIVLLIQMIFRYKEILKDMALFFLALLSLGLVSFTFLAIVLFDKPDGNYFVLVYATICMASLIFNFCFESKKRVCSSQMYIPFLIINILLSGGCNWAWISSFSTISLLNKGYYEHAVEYKNSMNNNGCIEIFQQIEQSGSSVFALGNHPNILRLPCQVYDDLDISYWGNSQLVENKENFENYLRQMNVKYIYIQPKYINKKSKYYDYICKMIIEGKIGDILVENNHILLTIRENEENTQNILYSFEKCFENDFLEIGFGFYEDGWLDKKSLLFIHNDRNKELKCTFYYPGTNYENKEINLYVNDSLVQCVDVQDTFTTVLIDGIEDYNQFKLGVETNFIYEAIEGDERDIAIILYDISLE